MARSRPLPLPAPPPLPTLPKWAAKGDATTPEHLAFRAGGVLAVLGAVLARDDVPVPLLAHRLALKAAVATLRIEGRVSADSAIRDAFHLTPPGDAMGPDGDALAFWRRAVRVGTGRASAGFDQTEAGFSEAELDGGAVLSAGMETAARLGPLAGSSEALRLSLEADPRAERMACLLSDIVLARSLGWAAPLPVSVLMVNKALLREVVSDRAALVKCQSRILEGLIEAHRVAIALTERAEALRRVAPKLRAKSSDAAVALFLREEAVLPSAMLSPVVRGTRVPMSDRAARRLCDRLVELGVATELTGRSSFRLYGIAP